MVILTKLIICLLFMLYINVSDWKYKKVRNRVVVPFCLAGLIFNLWTGGLSGLVAALAGGAIMFCLFPLFALSRYLY